ncbi:hypothetical protein MCOR07_008611 [Pyricularia oryzae]|uniref:Uncharacterized protein n=1 Tax=Pyricularia grisea TaxID=148305 RepID=A0ABQ8P0N2_PYRGI|nr:hypothetical protein MCOR01_002184 [Pyricularia oryzae]KAI6304879.1 hypothetical protein MCOR33_000002 [Pyricularia grisea]KAI6252452.1 hypothetical protein MCOR19_010930 [Pyricularia oryzae]KAI6288255.1 hypothetical protein MCOR26_000257 [Pyricularia oryzae]KAI6336680.1 hypothetical protein MCOR29_000059 [Pyricularia oryzae]
MDTVGWDAKGDWGCSRAAEKDKKAPAAPPALSFLVFRLPVSQTLLGAFGVWTARYLKVTRGRDLPDLIPLTQSPSRTSLPKCPVEEVGSGSDGRLALEAAGPYGVNHTVGAVRCYPLIHCVLPPRSLYWLGRAQYCKS